MLILYSSCRLPVQRSYGSLFLVCLDWFVGVNALFKSNISLQFASTIRMSSLFSITSIASTGRLTGRCFWKCSQTSRFENTEISDYSYSIDRWRVSENLHNRSLFFMQEILTCSSINLETLAQFGLTHEIPTSKIGPGLSPDFYE